MEKPYPAQGGAVLMGALAGGLLVAQQVAGKATRDALFLSQHTATELPPVMMAAALTSVAVALGAGRLILARGPTAALLALVGLNAGLLLAGSLLTSWAPGAAAMLVYLQVSATGATLISGYWSVVNERFDPWTAKRVVKRLGLGASLGGVAGGALAWASSSVISAATMLVVIAALNVATLVALVRFGAHARARGRFPGALPHSASSPLALLRGVPYLRHLALVVALGAAMEALLDYLLKAQAAATLTRGPELMAFFAAFHTATGLLALLAQVATTQPALEALGLAGTVALRPLAVAVTSLAALVDPTLWTAAFSRGAHDVSSNSLFRAGYELLFTPLPEAEKRGAKLVVDVGFDKLGAILGGGAALAAVGLLAAPGRALYLLVAALSVVALGLTGRLQRGYVTTLERNLRAGLVRLDPEEVVDSTTRLTLAESRLMTAGGPPSLAAASEAQGTAAADLLLRRVADLRSGESARTRRVLEEIGPVDTVLVAHLLPLLARDEVYLPVLRTLRRLAPRTTGQLLDTLLDPQAPPALRRRVTRVLKVCPTQRVVDGLLVGLEDERFDVREACARALVGVTARGRELRLPPQAVLAAVGREISREPGGTGEDPTGQGPRGSDAALARRASVDHIFTLLALLLDPEPLQVAAKAVRGTDPSLRGTAFEYLDQVLPPELGPRLLSWLGAGPARHGPRRPKPLG